MRRILAALLAMAVVLVVPTAASADVDFKVDARAGLDGGQEVPAVDTEMTGRVSIKVRADRLKFKLRVADSSNVVVAAHVHCGVPGANGPVGVTLFSGSFTDAKGVVASGRISAPDADNGCGWADMADVAAAIQAGGAYVNVHTSGVPSGEIRGDLGVKDFEVRARAGLDGGQEVPAVDTEMTGRVSIKVRADRLKFKLRVADSSNVVVAAHVHCGVPGANGPVGVTLFSGSFTAAKGVVASGRISAPDADNGCGWADMADVAAAIQAGGAYVNVHTSGVPSGEIRGDLT